MSSLLAPDTFLTYLPAKLQGPGTEWPARVVIISFRHLPNLPPTQLQGPVSEWPARVIIISPRHLPNLPPTQLQGPVSEWPARVVIISFRRLPNLPSPPNYKDQGQRSRPVSSSLASDTFLTCLPIQQQWPVTEWPARVVIISIRHLPNLPPHQTRKSSWPMSSLLAPDTFLTCLPPNYRDQRQSGRPVSSLSASDTFLTCLSAKLQGPGTEWPARVVIISFRHLPNLPPHPSTGTGDRVAGPCHHY